MYTDITGRGKSYALDSVDRAGGIGVIDLCYDILRRLLHYECREQNIMSGFETRRLSHALGAEVLGFDLSQDLDQKSTNDIRNLWDENLVLLFRDQHISPANHLDFTRHFGKPTQLESSHGVDGFPEILRVTNKLIDGKLSNTRNTGRNWHSDQTWHHSPAFGSILRCLENPDIGGDTMFTNLYLAYETLSPKLKDIIDGMEAVHDFALVAGLAARDPEYVAEMMRLHPPVVHKCVQVNSRTGRKALYLGDRVRHFVGMTEEESKPLLQLYVQHATRLEFTYRHVWRVGDLIMWQNRCTMHLALPDFDYTQPRDMQRTTILGDTIGQLWMPEAA